MGNLWPTRGGSCFALSRYGYKLCDMEEITTAEAAALLGKHQRTVRRYIDDGLLHPTKRLANGLILLSKEEVLQVAAIQKDETQKSGGN